MEPIVNLEETPGKFVGKIKRRTPAEAVLGAPIWFRHAPQEKNPAHSLPDAPRVRRKSDQPSPRAVIT